MDEREIFLSARQIADEAERLRFLHQACGADAELLRRLNELLSLDAQAGSFLEPSATENTQTVQLEGQAAVAPEAIGPYKLLQQIGEGGMGAVYMAEQTHPVKRLVALKLVKPGMDSRQVLARFQAERQALALMDHPNIARVLDAGTTDQGRPYFVMELVKGVPITQFCDERKLTPRERLELFIPVCQAVQHAHQKGVIHRDIKPSNVMVALYDGKPVPKVIDFGVAKAMGAKLTEATLYTGFGAIVGTPEYMSPEQAELNQLDIDTRSDIYSLGVLLYELLTGTTPLDRKRLKQAAILEVLRVIREEDPQRPSTRLSTTEELPSIAANRGVEPRKLTGTVRGELDWIVMKALEKDRNRRYETANGLATDIQRYLDDEAVTACPPSVGYRLRKVASRNKALLTTAGLVTLAMLVGTGVSIWQAVRATRAEGRAVTLLADAVSARNEALDRTREAETARKDAEAARQEADTQRDLLAANVDQAIQALDEVYFQVAEGPLLKDGELDEKSRQFLQNALPFYESFTQQKEDDPRSRLALARATTRVGAIQHQLRQSAAAESILRKALERWEARLAEDPNLREYRDGHADTLWLLVSNLREAGKLAEAETLYPVAERVFETLARDYPETAGYGMTHAAARRDLALTLHVQNRWEEAEPHYRKAVALFEARLKEHPADVALRYQAALTAQQLANLLREAGRSPEAEQQYFQAQRAYSDLNPQGGPGSELAGDRAHGGWLLATMMRDQSRIRESVPYFESTIERFRELIRLNPADPTLRLNLVSTTHDLALVHRDLADLPRALEAIEESQRMAQALATFWPENETYRMSLVRAEYESSSLLERLGRLEEAQQHSERARELLNALKADPPSAEWRRESSWAHTYAAAIAKRRSRLDLYERELRAALEDRLPLMREPGATWWDFEQPAYFANQLAEFLQWQGRDADALSAARQAHEAAQAGWRRFPDREFSHSLSKSAWQIGSLLAKLDRSAFDQLCDQDLDPHSRIGLGKSCHQSGFTDRAAKLLDLAMDQLRARAETLTDRASQGAFLSTLLGYHYIIKPNAWVTDGWTEAHLALRAEIERLLALWMLQSPDNEVFRRVAGDVHHRRGDELNRAGRAREAIESYNKALDMSSGSYWSLKNRGDQYARLGNRDAALADYRATQAIPCEEPAFFLSRAGSFASIGQHQDALEDYDRLLAMEPDNASAHTGRGKTLVWLGRGQEGLASMRRAEELEPANMRHLAARLAAMARSGQAKEAEEELRSRLRDSVDPNHLLIFYGLDVNSSPELMERAVAMSVPYGPALESIMNYNLACGHAAEGRIDPAFAALERSIETGGLAPEQVANDTDLISLREDPRFARYLERLKWSEHLRTGQGKFEAGQYREAIGDFEQAVELNPRHGELTHWLVRAHRANGQEREAEAAVALFLSLFEADVQARPNDARALRLRGEAHAQVGHLELALSDFDRALELAPDDLAVRLRRVQARFDQGDFAGAAADLQTGLDQHSNIPGLVELKNSVRLAQGRHGEVAQELKSQVESGKAPWRTYYELALVQAAAGDAGGYQATTRRMVETFGSSADATTLSFVAWTATLAPGGVEQPGDLLPLVEKAIAARSKSIHGVSKRGVVLYRKGEFAAAERELSELEAKWLSYPDHNLNSRAYGAYFLAMARQKLGHADAAREALARANDLAKQELDGSRSSVPWVRRLTMELLRKEAEALLGKEPGEPAAAAVPAGAAPSPATPDPEPGDKPD